MRIANPPSSLFIKNRERLASLLPEGALAVIHANDVPATNADGTLPFTQNSDLYHLSGIDQEETILVLYPSAPDPTWREILFLRETSELTAIWEGERYSKDEGKSLSGIENVRWTKDFPNLFRSLMIEASSVWLNTNEHPRAVITQESKNDRFIRECQNLFPLHRYERLATLMRPLRTIKSIEEIDILRTACQITESGFRRVLNCLKPGMKEYEIEAEYIYEFTRQGSSGFAYTPIIASGTNACVLHYIKNDQPCQDGDLLLMDVGATAGRYHADMTRTVPVNGKFTERQRQVYEAVLKILKDSSDLLRPGATFKEINLEVAKMMSSALIDLKLLKKKDVKAEGDQLSLYKKYFMHGLGHHLGLDVHDIGSTFNPLEVGNVLTVEPGIYIREEGIGVRLENDLWLQENENIDLMQSIPIEIDEIESLMNASK